MSKERNFYLTAALGLFCSASAVAQSVPASQAGGLRQDRIEEVVVTARQREEVLQNVPDAVTAFTAKTIEAAGIRQINDFMKLVPNLTYREGGAFVAGNVAIALRGIGNGQYGWPSVTYVVDGVPASSTDEINTGSLTDIERIEVLRGPQSALYGAGAIAGAINVITKRPTNEFEGKVRAGYSSGNTKEIEAIASGPLVKDKVLFRVSGSHLDSDGQTKSASNGLDLDFRQSDSVRARAIVMPSDMFEADLRFRYDKEDNGAGYQDKFLAAGSYDVFNANTNSPRRGFAGEQWRKMYNLSAKLSAHFSDFDIVSVTGYSHINQNEQQSTCYDDPSNPAVPNAQGGATCALGAAFGTRAIAGQATDEFYTQLDNYRTFTQDLRIVSSGEQRVRWQAGMSYLHREAFGGFDLGRLIAPNNTLVVGFPSWNKREDSWWGAYAQVSTNLAERLELTVAVRYDHNKYENTTYTDRTRAVVTLQPDDSGARVPMLKASGNGFQPKVQLSYKLQDDVMAYATYSTGFRAGFYSSAVFAVPEKTKNYEAGIKATLFDRRLLANAAVFHIDYSNQQFSRILAVAPFRQPVTIPKTSINGAEGELTLVANEYLRFGAGLGYLDARVSNDTASPYAPKWTANLSADLVYPIAGDLRLRGHADYRFQAPLYLGTANAGRIGPKEYVNVRAGVENDRWSLIGYAKNLLNTREPVFLPSAIAGATARQNTPERRYGIEGTYRF